MRNGVRTGVRAHRVPLMAALALGTFAAVSAPATAAPIVYTFSAPEFALNETTPLINRTPNIGDPTFDTDFSSSPLANGFTVTSVIFNSLFSGQSLAEPSAPQVGDVLALAFSSPISSLQVDFALHIPLGAPPGRLDFASPVGHTSQASANVGGSWAGGTLIFNSAAGFTTATLRGFAQLGLPVEFAIDNLTLETTPTAVPEPASLMLVGTGIAGALARSRRRVARHRK